MKCEIIDNTAGGKSFKYCKTHKVEPHMCPVDVGDMDETTLKQHLEGIIAQDFASWLPKQTPKQPKSEIFTGAKAKFVMNGKVVAEAENVSYSFKPERVDFDRTQKVLDDTEIKLHKDLAVCAPLYDGVDEQGYVRVLPYSSPRAGSGKSRTRFQRTEQGNRRHGRSLYEE